MAGWKQTIAGSEVKIHNVDHLPPHCHAVVGGRDLRIDLRTLDVLNPPPEQLPPPLRRGLAETQEELLVAWDKVKVVPSGSSPGVW